MRRLIQLSVTFSLFCLTQTASTSMVCSGAWAVGAWNTSAWASAAWQEDLCPAGPGMQRRQLGLGLSLN